MAEASLVTPAPESGITPTTRRCDACGIVLVAWSTSGYRGHVCSDCRALLVTQLALPGLLEAGYLPLPSYYPEYRRCLRGARNEGPDDIDRTSGAEEPPGPQALKMRSPQGDSREPTGCSADTSGVPEGEPVGVARRWGQTRKEVRKALSEASDASLGLPVCEDDLDHCTTHAARVSGALAALRHGELASPVRVDAKLGRQLACTGLSEVEVIADPGSGKSVELVRGYCKNRVCPLCHTRYYRERQLAVWKAFGYQPYGWYSVVTIEPEQRKRHAPTVPDRSPGAPKGKRKATFNYWSRRIRLRLERWFVRNYGVLPPILVTPHYDSKEAAERAIKAGKRIPLTTHYNIVIGARGLRAVVDGLKGPFRFRFAETLADVDLRRPLRPGATGILSGDYDDHREPPGNVDGADWHPWRYTPEARVGMRDVLGEAIRVRPGRMQWKLRYRDTRAKMAHAIRYSARGPGDMSVLEKFEGAPRWAQAQAERAIAEARVRMTPDRVEMYACGGAIPKGRGGAPRREAFARLNPIPEDELLEREIFKTRAGMLGEEFLSETVERRTVGGKVKSSGGPISWRRWAPPKVVDGVVVKQAHPIDIARDQKRFPWMVPGWDDVPDWPGESPTQAQAG